MSRTVCEHFNPIDQPCDQCNSETRQTLELELARHAALIRQIFNAAYAPRKPLTDEEVVTLFNRLCQERSAWPERRYRDFARWVERAHGITGDTE